MSGYLLDTTVLIDHAAGHEDGVEILAQLAGETSDLYACDITTSEALSGGLPDERAIITRLLGALEYLAVDPDSARWAGHRRRELRAQGRPSPLGDSLIAAVAWRMDATVVTRHPGDFEPFRVKVLGYGVPVLDDGNPPQAKAGTKRGSTS